MAASIKKIKAKKATEASQGVQRKEEALLRLLFLHVSAMPSSCAAAFAPISHLATVMTNYYIPEAE